MGPRRDGVWRETGIVEKFPESGPRVKWRAEIGGGFSGPAVANGRVYVTDRQLAKGAKNPNDPFQRGMIPGSERVLCLNEADGRLIWRHEYDCPYSVSYAAGPRTTPLVRDGRVYTLGTEGHLFCFDAADGKVIWSRDFKKDFGAATPLWGFSAHPLLVGNRLICLAGGPGSTVVALDKENGRELWRALTTKEPGYSPPTLIEAGGKPQLIIWHPEAVASLDPENGKVFWSEPWTIRSALSLSMPRQAGNSLFLTAFYDGSLLLRLAADKPAATVVWKSRKASERDTTELHSIISTPVFENGHVYGVCSYGQLRCLKADTGERLWETLAATTRDGKEARWANAFLVKNGDRFFICNELGDLIIARLSPRGYEEISRTHLLEPTGEAAGRAVVWSHPAFANRTVFARNDRELVAVDLSR
jgi:outer membrane protein assembly factor BamB